MRYSRMRISHKIFLVAVITLIITGFTVLRSPDMTAEPAASPTDSAKEDLSRIEYPSQAVIKWHPRFIKPEESLESLFGEDWVLVARFNRVDRRHVYPGMTIKVPDNIEEIRNYTPLPLNHPPAKRHEKYILIDVTEQWLGAYEYGKLVFSAPAATGKAGHETPLGIFRITSRHVNHTSSLYKISGREEQYPMYNALRFHFGDDNVSYWIHARDLPGRPASHGCVGLFDEQMQLKTFRTPKIPVLKDSQRLYEWAAGEEVYGEDSGQAEELDDGAVVEIRGGLPIYLEKPPLVASR